MPNSIKPSKLLTAFALFLCSLSFANLAQSQNSAAAAQSDDLPQAMLVMDFSGSMWGEVNGSAKFQVLQSIIDQNFDQWNKSLDLGVLAYGHRRKGDCRDIELAYRPGKALSREMRTWITSQKPVGKTPLGDSLVTASTFFNNQGQEANLIVLSDGIESCGVDPCQVIRDLQAGGAKMTAHVIGFDLNARDANQIRCIADLTGGTYVDANRADQLIDGFRKAVENIAVKDDSAERALRETLDQTLDALRETSDQLANAERRADEALQNLAAANEELSRLAGALADQEAIIEQLEAALKDCDDEVARLQGEIARLEGEVADLQAENANLAALLKDAQGTIADQERALERADVNNQQLVSSLAEQEAIIDEKDAEIDAISDELNAANTENALLNDENTRLETLLNEALRNRQLTVTSLDFGAFAGTTEPVDIAALVAERDAYLAALQSLRLNLSYILDPLSTAQAIANNVPEEGNQIPVPEELNEVLVLLAPGVEGELPDLEWSMTGVAGQARGYRDIGTGARIPLPEFGGTFDIALELPGYEATLNVTSDPENPISRRTDLNIGRLSLHMPGSQAGVFFATIMTLDGEVVVKQPIETSGSMYMQPGLYKVRAQTENGVDEFEAQVYAGKDTSVPLHF